MDEQKNITIGQITAVSMPGDLENNRKARLLSSNPHLCVNVSIIHFPLLLQRFISGSHGRIYISFPPTMLLSVAAKTIPVS